MELHGNEFTDTYEKNKEIVNKLVLTPSKKLRNAIAGYITRLVKKSKEPKKLYSSSDSGEDIEKFYK